MAYAVGSTRPLVFFCLFGCPGGGEGGIYCTEYGICRADKKNQPPTYAVVARAYLI